MAIIYANPNSRLGRIKSKINESVIDASHNQSFQLCNKRKDQKNSPKGLFPISIPKRPKSSQSTGTSGSTVSTINGKAKIANRLEDAKLSNKRKHTVSHTEDLQQHKDEIDDLNMSLQLHTSSIISEDSKSKEKNRKERMAKALANDSFPKNRPLGIGLAAAKKLENENNSLFSKLTVGPLCNPNPKQGDSEFVHSQQLKKDSKNASNEVIIILLSLNRKSERRSQKTLIRTITLQSSNLYVFCYYYNAFYLFRLIL